MTAIVDTSFLVAIASRQDKNHTRAFRLAQTLDEPLLVPISVLPEACYLLASRLGHAAMRQFLQQLVSSDTAVAHITSTDLQRALEILTQYADSKLDFVDARWLPWRSARISSAFLPLTVETFPSFSLDTTTILNFCHKVSRGEATGQTIGHVEIPFHRLPRP